MKTREELINYFNEKYEDNRFMKPDFESKSDEALTQAYELDMYINEEQNNILENGLTTYRVTYETEETQEEIVEYMKENKMYTYDEDGLKLRVRIGNFCIVHVPSYFVERLKEKFGSRITFIDLETKWLGRNDFHGIKIGDKVKVTVNGIFGNSNDQGTVHAMDDNSITIRKYRSKTKGYVLNIGEQGDIEKIKSFMKVS